MEIIPIRATKNLKRAYHNYFSFILLWQGSPDCHFEESMCEWEAQEGWVLDPILVGLEKWGKLTNFSNMVYQKERQQAAGKLATDVPCEFYNLAVRVNRPNKNSN